MNEPSNQTFLITKEYRRFAEFCDACREYRYIGLCYGAAGVGKTLSALHYSNWEKTEKFAELYDTPVKLEWRDVIDNHTVFYTQHAIAGAGATGRKIQEHIRSFNRVIDRAKGEQGFYRANLHFNVEQLGKKGFCQLIVIDEADRLTQATLEVTRDIYDTYQTGMVLIGMPGIEKRLSRYAQFYSRVGFVHHYKPISEEEFEHIMKYKWKELGFAFDPSDFSDREALSDILRITRGNFRLLHRLFTQIDRIMKINSLSFLSKEVVEAARENLIIGSV